MNDDPALSANRREVLVAAAGLVGVTGCLGNGEDDDGSQTTLGDPQLWLHPDSGTVTDGDKVETWLDDSGNGYDFTQEEKASQPSLVEDAVNGQSALRFDGEDDHFVRRDTIGIPNDSPRTFVVVSKLSDLGARSPFLMQGKFDATEDESNSYGLEANTFRTAGERFGFYLVSVAKDSERPTDTDYNVHVLRTAEFPELTAMEQSTTYYINGQQTPFGDTPGGTRNPQFEGDSTAIGSFSQSSPSTLMHGEIAEIRVYDRALDDSERSSLEEQLMEKYGIEGA